MFVAAAIVFGVAAQGNKSTVVRKQVSLKSGGKEITAIELENTHKRFYRDPFAPPMSPNRCSLVNTAEGVIWRIVCEGKDISAKEVSLDDESGRKFIQTCWTKRGTVYTTDANGQRTGGGPRTEFLVAGPEDSKKVKITFGDASAEVEIPK